jgi:hypothetical protein
VRWKPRYYIRRGKGVPEQWNTLINQNTQAFSSTWDESGWLHDVGPNHRACADYYLRFNANNLLEYTAQHASQCPIVAAAYRGPTTQLHITIVVVYSLMARGQWKHIYLSIL